MEVKSSDNFATVKDHCVRNKLRNKVRTLTLTQTLAITITRVSFLTAFTVYRASFSPPPSLVTYKQGFI